MISVIIPAQNEARYIERCINSAHENLQGFHEYEIILVDNASTDATAAIAQKMGVKILSLPSKSSPSAVRNLGVSEAKGDVYLFLDGDVYLDPQWHIEAAKLLPRIQSERVLTGSTYDVDPDASWVAKAWFGPLFERQDKFVNAGHLLISSKLFNELGGFNEKLETGEDTEFCLRAKNHGVDVFCYKNLRSIHLGYPNDLGHFFRRERWHGKGNFLTWKQITSSKIPVLVLFHALSFFVALLLPIFTGDWRWLLVYPVVALTLSFAGAFKWLGGFAPNFPACMFLSWWYLTARAFSFFDVFWLKIRQKST